MLGLLRCVVAHVRVEKDKWEGSLGWIFLWLYMAVFGVENINFVAYNGHFRELEFTALIVKVFAGWACVKNCTDKSI